VSKLKSSLLSLVVLLLFCQSTYARYAAIVVDVETGRVVHEVESTHRWYPASLTKVMTVYMTLVAIESGHLQLDDMLTVSRHAALQPNSKLGLVQGQRISVENAIKAVTTRSANDAAVVLAERLGGTEGNFAAMMTRQAHSLGMYNSAFRNASGLPDEGQISSARDLAVLSTALIRNFPRHYHYFSLTEFAYKGRVLPNTNKILKTYPDADGLKTGFTCGSGYNLIASAKRNGHRLVAVLLGGHSSAERFNQMGNLLDLGFEKTAAGNLGVPLVQLHDNNVEPPPFQLAFNRCAGSAEQMGADIDHGERHAAIHIKPDHPGPRLQQVAVKPAKHRPPPTRSSRASKHTGDKWAVMLGDQTRKVDADAKLSQTRRHLGVLAKTGQPRVVGHKVKGKQVWRTLWTGLAQSEASSFCKKLRTKNQDCTVLPG